MLEYKNEIEGIETEPFFAELNKSIVEHLIIGTPYSPLNDYEEKYQDFNQMRFPEKLFLQQEVIKIYQDPNNRKKWVEELDNRLSQMGYVLETENYAPGIMGEGTLLILKDNQDTIIHKMVLGPYSNVLNEYKE